MGLFEGDFFYVRREKYRYGDVFHVVDWEGTSCDILFEMEAANEKAENEDKAEQAKRRQLTLNL